MVREAPKAEVAHRRGRNYTSAVARQSAIAREAVDLGSRAPKAWSNTPRRRPPTAVNRGEPKSALTRRSASRPPPSHEHTSAQSRGLMSSG